MKVWVVLDQHNMSDSYIGVYGSREKAEDVLSNLKIVWTQHEKNIYCMDMNLPKGSEVPVDVLNAKVDYDMSFYEILEDDIYGS
jgi:hypothetical protein